MQIINTKNMNLKVVVSRNDIRTYSNINIKELINTLSYMIERRERGLIGGECLAITVNSWNKLIRSVDDIKEVRDYYAEYSEEV